MENNFGFTGNPDFESRKYFDYLIALYGKTNNPEVLSELINISDSVTDFTCLFKVMKKVGYTPVHWEQLKTTLSQVEDAYRVQYIGMALTSFKKTISSPDKVYLINMGLQSANVNTCYLMELMEGIRKSCTKDELEIFREQVFNISPLQFTQFYNLNPSEIQTIVNLILESLPEKKWQAHDLAYHLIKNHTQKMDPTQRLNIFKLALLDWPCPQNLFYLPLSEVEKDIVNARLVANKMAGINQ